MFYFCYLVFLFAKKFKFVPTNAKIYNLCNAFSDELTEQSQLQVCLCLKREVAMPTMYRLQGCTDYSLCPL